MKPSLFLNLRDRNGRDPGFGMTFFQPVHGDDILPLETTHALSSGVGRTIDLLIGATTDEANAFLAPANLTSKIKSWQATLALRAGLPRSGAALRAYGNQFSSHPPCLAT